MQHSQHQGRRAVGGFFKALQAAKSHWWAQLQRLGCKCGTGCIKDQKALWFQAFNPVMYDM